MTRNQLVDFWNSLKNKAAQKSEPTALDTVLSLETKSDIPKPIQESIFEITKHITETHKAHVFDALVKSWESGGLGIILKENGFQYHAKWTTFRSNGEAPKHLGTALVVLEASRAVATCG